MVTRFEEAIRILNYECMEDLAAYVRDLHESHETLLKKAQAYMSSREAYDIGVRAAADNELREAIRLAEELQL